jgi:hypothetical protein
MANAPPRSHLRISIARDSGYLFATIDRDVDTRRVPQRQ